MDKISIASQYCSDELFESFEETIKSVRLARGWYAKEFEKEFFLFPSMSNAQINKVSESTYNFLKGLKK